MGKKIAPPMILVSLGIFLFLLTVYSFLVEPHSISTNIVSIANDGLYSLFGSKKAVHISDLHITSIGYREEKLISMLNQINPEIIFITGDLTTYGENEEACIEVLRRINRPAYGIWVVLGNTDKYKDNRANKDMDGFVQKLRKSGIKVLRNSHERLDLNENGDHLFIAGIEGSYLSRSRLEWLLRDVPDNSPVLLLSHYPDVIKDNTDAILVNLQENEDDELAGWGWQDNAFFEHDSGIVRFEKDGKHTIRIQRREDGVAIEQICLVRANNNRTPADSPIKNLTQDKADIYGPINPDSSEMIIIKAEDIQDQYIYGSWKKVHDPSAGFDVVIKDSTDDEVKNEIPLKHPEDYFEVNFIAKGRIDYHVWLRMKAEDNSGSSDSVYVQFDDSINGEGEPIYRMDKIGSRKKMKNINLILAGHTHGGQVRFPIIGAIDIVPNHRIHYDMGLFENKGTKMYVNRGIGNTLLPVRFLSPPEITVFDFKREGS